MVKREEFAKLLNTPFRRGVGCDVGVQDAAGADFHGDENIQKSERCCDSDKEVAGYHAARVIAYEGGPALAGNAPAWAVALQILANGSRGNAKAEFQIQFVGDAAFAPSRVIGGHLSDQGAEVLWQGWSTGSLAFAGPEGAEGGAVPFEESFGFHDYQGVAPGEEAGQGDHDEAEERGGAAGAEIPLFEQGQLFSQEEVFGEHRGAGGEEVAEEGHARAYKSLGAQFRGGSACCGPQGTRITVELILEKPTAGQTAEQILNSHPSLTEDGVRAAIGFAASVLSADVVYPMEQVRA